MGRENRRSSSLAKRRAKRSLAGINCLNERLKNLLIGVILDTNKTMKFFYIILILLSFEVQSQNLIPNSGFEETTGCPGASVFLKNVKYWSKIDNHYGTPDQFYMDCSYNGLNNSMAHGQHPFAGKGFAGSFCYGSNLREYMKVPLNAPMIKDSVYYIEFYVLPATGYGTFIDSYGVHFSEEAPQGRDERSLSFVPLEEHIGNPCDYLITDTINWTKISGMYTAKGGETFATFGNFKPDSYTKNELFKKNAIVTGRSYMLLDGISVDYASQIEEDTSTVVAVTEEVIDSISIVDTVVPYDRKLIVRDEFKATSRTIRITIWDHVQQDGDSINLILNDEIVLDHFAIKKKKYKLELKLKPGENQIKLHALNLGHIPPNTASIRISDGKNKRTFILRSDLGTTECLRVWVE